MYIDLVLDKLRVTTMHSVACIHIILNHTYKYTNHRMSYLKFGSLSLSLSLLLLLLSVMTKRIGEEEKEEENRSHATEKLNPT